MGSPFGGAHVAASPLGAPLPVPLHLPSWVTNADSYGTTARPPTSDAAVDQRGGDARRGLGISEWRGREPRDAQTVEQEKSPVASGSKRRWEAYVADSETPFDIVRRVIGRHRPDLTDEAVAALILIAMSRGRTYVDEDEEIELTRGYQS
jgi:hypothetical protein